MVAGLVMVASYFLSSMATMNEGLGAIADLLPYAYFQGGDAINGLEMSWLLGLLAETVMFAALTWWRFSKRDIRVGGEGGWKLPFR